MKHILKGNVRGEYEGQKKRQINQFIHLCPFKFKGMGNTFLSGVLHSKFDDCIFPHILSHSTPSTASLGQRDLLPWSAHETART